MSQGQKKLKQRNEKKENEKSKENNPNDENETSELKYGRLPTFPYQRLWSRCILILAILIIVWYNSTQSKEVSFARQKDILLSRTQNIECSQEYKMDLDKYAGCIPEKCARVVSDKLISTTETDVLLKLAINGLKLGGSNASASILDLHSGSLSKGNSFINIFLLPEASKIFNPSDFAIYKVVKTKIHHAIAHHFGVDYTKIYLTKPTFFSRMTNATAKTVHDQYWLPHVDKVTYEDFHYTSLLYLNDYGRDFDGGRFIFIDKNVNSTLEPRKGRVSMFTSGAENLHAVERVTSGTRYVLTISFTCNIDAAISDPMFGKSVKYP